MNEADHQALLITIGIFALAFIMAARLGRWYLFQTVIFAAVMCAGVYFKWTIGAYATSFVAYGASFIATKLVAMIVAAVAGLRSQRRNERQLKSQPTVSIRERVPEGLPPLARG